MGIGAKFSFLTKNWEVYDKQIQPEDAEDFDMEVAHFTEHTTYADAVEKADRSWEKWEYFFINDQGEVMPWRDIDSTPEELEEVWSKYNNLEMIISATEFEGRSIDLVFSLNEVGGMLLDPWALLPEIVPATESE